MKKLLIISDSFMPRADGVARFLAEIIPRLTDKYDITVLAPDVPGDFAPPINYAIVRIALSRFSINDFPIVRWSKKIVRHYVEQSDLVWVQSASSLGITGILEAKRAHKPLATFNHVIEWEIVEHSVPGPRIFKKLAGSLAKLGVRYLYNKCDVIMVPSVDVSYKLEDNGVVATQVLTPLGVDTDKFEPTDKLQAKVRLDIPPECFVIGFVGRLGREKDLPTLFSAFADIAATHKSVRLLIVGKGVLSDDPFLKQPSVIYVGPKTDVVPYYQAMDVFVLPSMTETTALAAVEAMSCGVPVMTTPIPAIREYLRNNENGILFPKGNSFVLKKKLLYLMSHPQLQLLLSDAGRATVEQKFSWQRTVNRIKDVLEHL